jgi:hypothetical protein
MWPTGALALFLSEQQRLRGHWESPFYRKCSSPRGAGKRPMCDIIGEPRNNPGRIHKRPIAYFA